MSLPTLERKTFVSKACEKTPKIRSVLLELLDHREQTGLDDFHALVSVSMQNWLDDDLKKEAAVSHFRILEQIGAGGMGLVYKARDVNLDRIVALKFLPPHLDLNDDVTRRFVQEAKTASTLDHPNICTIYEIGVTGSGRHFIAMAYYEGKTVRERLDAGPIPVDEALDIAIQIAKGLQSAHQHGILHRDVKPANVMIDKSRRIKLLDFGIAKIRSLGLTKTGVTPGTVSYMSPEQIRGEELGPPSDIWSLGIVLYEMLAGRRPFVSDADQAVIYLILNEEIDFSGASLEHVPETLRQVLSLALQKNPDNRFEHMQALIQSLQAIQAGKSPHETEADLPERQRASIAVLPFTDMSPSRDHDFFCEGVAEEILNALNRIAHLRVTARTSSFVFKGANLDVRDIGKRLNVETLLEGSIRTAGNQLRVSVQLINARDGYQLWSQRFEREMKDIFAIQDEIAEQTVRSLRGVFTETDRQVLKQSPVGDFAAYEHYLKGKQYINFGRRTSINYAISQFEKSIDIDVQFAPAYAAHAMARYILYQWYGQNEQDRRLAIQASEKAVELAPHLPEPRVAKGLALALNNRFDEAVSEMEIAMSFNPRLYDTNYLYGRICFMNGKLEKAALQFERASRIDPDEFQATILSGLAYDGLGLKEKAIDSWKEGVVRARRRLELNPSDVRAVNLLANVLIQLGDIEEGIALLNRGLEMAPHDPTVVWNAACGYARARLFEQALDTLERAIELGIANKKWLEHDPDMDPLRDHPRFIELFGRLKHPGP